MPHEPNPAPVSDIVSTSPNSDNSDNGVNASMQGETTQDVRRTRNTYWDIHYNITPIEVDRVRRNKDWEKILASLTAIDVFSITQQIFLEVPDDRMQELLQKTRDTTKERQHLAAQALEFSLSDNGQIGTVWLLLPEHERQRHILVGLEAACEMALMGSEDRALCPELSVKQLRKGAGQAYVDFLVRFAEEAKRAEPGRIFTFASAWWDSATDLLPNSPSENDEFILEWTTLHRNDFIACFVIKSVVSVVHDIVNRSQDMDLVLNLMDKDVDVAIGLASGFRNLGAKPPVRCQNCQQDLEESSRGTKLSVCSVCNAKLKIRVYYCSHNCQKTHWPEHKKICGKSLPDSHQYAAAGGNPVIFDLMSDLPHRKKIAVTDITAGSPVPGFERSDPL
ncbi:hypothetical protein SCP_1700580 [Sparassis crispa]|uniref:MYND-type domain-containing protein n=1 Tax=Sparassis crispa TaxID=139825 RepID=A0A401H5R9_9APHY|nr:hypothetical protein SCP_1700580 [Sparassis crispa]GBE89733.1 hypothetical protein SCP_1700580 [Sparassis crispa]